MAAIDKEYFIVAKPRQDFADQDLFPSLSAHQDTQGLPFRYERMPSGSRPLKFTNGYKDCLQPGQTTIKHPPDILFDGSNPLVRDDVREKLLQIDISNLEIQPAIYVDDWDVWHENYWYLTFTERLDCWSRNNSDYDSATGPVRLGGVEFFEVNRYRLDEEIMKRTPLRERLLFQMGGSLEAPVVAHISIAHYFSGKRIGAQVISLEDFPDGY